MTAMEPKISAVKSDIPAMSSDFPATMVNSPGLKSDFPATVSHITDMVSNIIATNTLTQHPATLDEIRELLTTYFPSVYGDQEG